MPKKSDYNVLVLLDRDRADARSPRRRRVARAWREAGNPPPMTMTVAEWRGSSDIFPMEYADILERHRVLHGSRPFEGIGSRERPAAPARAAGDGQAAAAAAGRAARGHRRQAAARADRGEPQHDHGALPRACSACTASGPTGDNVARRATGWLRSPGSTPRRSACGPPSRGDASSRRRRRATCSRATSAAIGARSATHLDGYLRPALSRLAPTAVSPTIVPLTPRSSGTAHHETSLARTSASARAGRAAATTRSRRSTSRRTPRRGRSRCSSSAAPT